MASDAGKLFKEHGAMKIVECWGTMFQMAKSPMKRAVKAQDNENIVFSWIGWPSKKARDEGNKKIMADPRMQPGPDMPFDGEADDHGRL